MFGKSVNGKSQVRRMSNRGRIKALTVSLVIVFVTAGVCCGRYSGGDGTAENPYRIATAEDLNDIGSHVEDFNKCFVMVNDINLADYTGAQFNIIGDYLQLPFTGVFDGNGHTIWNFGYESTQQNEETGIFGYVSDANAVIRDVKLQDPNIRGGPANFVGALAGIFQSGTVRGCSVEGGIVAGRLGVGGLIGWSGPDDPSWPGARVIDCYTQTNVQATNDCAGGLVGSNVGGVGGVVANCYAKGDVEGADWVGGLVGNNYGSIADCYATGAAVGQAGVGGLAGYNGGPIARSYSAGPVSGTSDVGGLLGATAGAVSDCVWDIETSEQAGMCGRDFGSGCNDRRDGKTTAEMQTRSTFTDRGWDFVSETVNGPNDVWRMCADGVHYPKLRFEFAAGDLVCADGVNLVDLSYFAARWMDSDCSGANDCDHADLDLSGVVDGGDLKILCDHWLEATN